MDRHMLRWNSFIRLLGELAIAGFISYFLSLTDNKTKAIITASSYAYGPVMSGAVASEIPLVYDLDRPPLEKVETGNSVKIDAEKEKVIVTK